MQRFLGACRLSLAIAAGAFLLAAAPAFAQRPQFTEFHDWLDVATIVRINERLAYDGDYGVRGALTDSGWTLIYVRPSVRYQAKNWLRLHGGAALFYNFFTGPDLPELRPWVGARFVGPRPGGWTISNYFRLEYRAFYLEESSEWSSSLRFRWQLQAVSPRFEIGGLTECYGILSVEPFFQVESLTEGGFGDRFRFNAGLGRPFGKKLRAELNYVFHTIRVPERGGGMTFDDHVVRLRFFYTFH